MVGYTTVSNIISNISCSAEDISLLRDCANGRPLLRAEAVVNYWMLANVLASDNKASNFFEKAFSQNDFQKFLPFSCGGDILDNIIGDFINGQTDVFDLNEIAIEYRNTNIYPFLSHLDNSNEAVLADANDIFHESMELLIIYSLLIDAFFAAIDTYIAPALEKKPSPMGQMRIIITDKDLLGAINYEIPIIEYVNKNMAVETLLKTNDTIQNEVSFIDSLFYCLKRERNESNALLSLFYI